MATAANPAKAVFRFVPSYVRYGLAPAGDATAEEASFAYFDALVRSKVPFVGLALGSLPFADPAHRYSAYEHSFQSTTPARYNLVCTDFDLKDRAWDRCWEEGKINVAILAAWPPVRTKDQRDVLVQHYQRFVVPHSGMVKPLATLGMNMARGTVFPPEPEALERLMV